VSDPDSANWLKPHAAWWLKPKSPSVEWLSRWITRSDDVSDHWEWSINPNAKHPRRFNERKQAIVSWTPGPHFRRGIFVVARVLLENQEAQLETRTRFKSICHLSQCVNPGHWQRVDPPTPWRMQAYASGVWQLVRIVNDHPATRTVVVRAKFDDVVHLVAIAPLEQRSLAPPRAICGVELDPTQLVVTSQIITCPGCL
jgi:hypothetical protein